MKLNSIATKNNDIIPIGKTSSEVNTATVHLDSLFNCFTLVIQPVEEEEDEEEDEEHEDDDSESRDEAEDSDIDVDSFTVNGPNFSRDMGGDGPPRLGNLTMDLSEQCILINIAC